MRGEYNPTHEGWGEHFAFLANPEEKAAYARLGEKAYRRMSTQARYHIADAYLLMELLDKHKTRGENIYDWVCIVLPVCLALETELFLLADTVGLKYDEHATIGRVFNSKNIEQLSASIDDKRKQAVIKMQLNDMAGFIQQYRNGPIHAHGKPLVENAAQAKGKIESILEKLKSTLEILSDVGL